VVLQHLIVYGVVSAAFAYTAWALMPRSWRASLLRRMGRSPAESGSACGGCDSCGPKPPPREQSIRIHRR
jgi:hypothetical protein